MSHLTAERIDSIAERMGMTPAQALQVMVAQGAAAASRAANMVDAKQETLIDSLLEADPGAPDGT